jgi:hypothetical protein
MVFLLSFTFPSYSFAGKSAHGNQLRTEWVTPSYSTMCKLSLDLTDNENELIYLKSAYGIQNEIPLLARVAHEVHQSTDIQEGVKREILCGIYNRYHCLGAWEAGTALASILLPPLPILSRTNGQNTELSATDITNLWRRLTISTDESDAANFSTLSPSSPESGR